MVQAEYYIPKHEMLYFNLNFATAAVFDFSGNVKPNRPLLGVTSAVNSLLIMCWCVTCYKAVK